MVFCSYMSEKTLRGAGFKNVNKNQKNQKVQRNCEIHVGGRFSGTVWARELIFTASDFLKKI